MVILELMYNWSDVVIMDCIKAMDPVTMMIIAGLGAAGNIAGSAIAGKNSKDANKAAEKTLNDQQAKNEAWLAEQTAANDDWYRQKMNENYLDSVEAQAALNKSREMAVEQMAQARARQAVMGGTDASIASTQQAVNKMLGDTASNLVATGAARKDAAEQTYLNRNDAFSQAYMNRNRDLSQQLINMYGQRAANNAAAGSSALNGLSSIGSSLLTALGQQ